MWKTRNLSIKGKITVLRSQALPLILYAATMLYISDTLLNEIDQLLFDFIWPKGKHHVKKDVLTKSIEHGGLKMPDIKAMVKSIKLTWIKRLVTKENNFTTLSKAILKVNDLKLFLSYKNDTEFLNRALPPFYTQILKYWYELFSVEPVGNAEVRNEHLWYNKYIIIDRKPAFYEHWNNIGITKINDLVTEAGSFKTINEINNEFNTTVNLMDFNSIKSAIPKKWRKMLTNSNFCRGDEMNLQVKICNKMKDVSTIICKEIYWEFIDRKQCRPTAVTKWEEIYYYVNFEWQYIYTLPYKVARETYLQSLHFQIINRYFPCALNIHKWYPEESSKCKYCDIEDSVEHYFSECVRVRPFWNWFRNWINGIYNCNIMFSSLDIIFGIPNLNEVRMFNVMNFCILLAKDFIQKSKKQDTEIIVEKYKISLKDRLQMEKLLLTSENKESLFFENWNPIYITL